MNHTTYLLLAIYFIAQTSIAQVQTTVRPHDPTTVVKPVGPIKPTEPGPIKPGPTKPGPVTPVPVTPGPVTPVPVTPPTPPKKTLDRNQLDLIVRRATSEFTQDLLDILGDAYQVRYNVREGMVRAANRIGNYEVDYVVQNTSEFQYGASQGRAEGKSGGESAGRSAAHSHSYSVAQSEINAAIDRTLDSGAAIQFTQNPRMASYAGASSSLSAPRNIESRLGDNPSQKENLIRRLLRREPPSEYLNGLLNLSSIYRYHSTDIPSDFRLSRVFRSWFDNDLRVSSSSSAAARDFYREITNVNLFEQATENARYFQNEFESHMNLERPWDRRVRSPNIAAVNLGEALYMQEASEYAHDRGYYLGYNEVFSASSISSFNSSYLPSYRSNFSSIENQVRTSAQVSEIQAQIVSEEGKSEVTYGDTFNVVLNRIANRGMVAADVDVEIPEQNQVTSFNNKGSVRVNGLTRLTESKSFARLGWISALTAADQEISISARVHNSTVSVKVKATYEELIRKALRHNSPEHADYMLKMAMQFMKKQYDDLSGFNDQYADRKPDMLLVRVRKLFDSLTENEKIQLRANGQLIRNVFGGKPSRFLNPKRDEWDAAQAMINEMALSGNVPSEVNQIPSNQNNNDRNY